jgi:hypothetical protein
MSQATAGKRTRPQFMSFCCLLSKEQGNRQKKGWLQFPVGNTWRKVYDWRTFQKRKKN